MEGLIALQKAEQGVDEEAIFCMYLLTFLPQEARKRSSLAGLTAQGLRQRE